MKHYHIVMDSEDLHYPEIVNSIELESQKEFLRLVLWTYDVFQNNDFYKNIERMYPNPNEGQSPLVQLSRTKAIFRGGTTITRHVCYRDCVDVLRYQEMNYDDLSEPDFKIRDTIYEI